MDNSERLKFAKAVIKNDEINRKKIINQNKQTYLYKYRKGKENDLSALENNCMWLSKANEFNYPYDSLIFATQEDMNNFANQIFPKQIFDYETERNEIIEYVNTHIAYHQERFNISALSEKNNCMLMWSHYANYHKGFCIAYEYEEIASRNTIYPVVYDCDELKYNSLSFEDKLNLQGLIKAKVWESEAEWRIINVSMYDTSDEKGLLLHNFIPKAIYMGYRIDKVPDLMIRLKNYAKNNKIDLYQMKLSYLSLGLLPEKVLL